MGYAPENTLKSVSKALGLGAPWVEVDVYFIDGHLVVIHDDTLERTTNGSGRVMDRTFSYLRSLDAGEGEKIPTLTEVLDLTAGRAGVNIELKGPGTAEPVVTLLRERLDRNRYEKKILLSSFDQGEIAKAKQIDKRIRIGILISDASLDHAAVAQKMGAYSVHPRIDRVTTGFVEAAHRRDLKVFVYTVDDPADIRRMHALNVDGVFTNYPDRVLNFLRDKAGHTSKTT